MSQRRSVTPWFPVAVDPVHEGIYEVEYRQSRFLFRREWRDGVWAIPGAVTVAGVAFDGEAVAHDVPWDTDPRAATRRAIVLAAADMAN